MERAKVRFGYQCTLSREEVEYASRESILSLYLEKWKTSQDGKVTLRVAPWILFATPMGILRSSELMELFMEGLGEGLFETDDVWPHEGQDILHREY